MVIAEELKSRVFVGRRRLIFGPHGLGNACRRNDEHKYGRLGKLANEEPPHRHQSTGTAIQFWQGYSGSARKARRDNQVQEVPEEASVLLLPPFATFSGARCRTSIQMPGFVELS